MPDEPLDQQRLSYLLSCDLEIDIDLCLKMPTAELAQT